MKPICMAKVGSLNLQRDKAVDNGGLRYGAIESALRPPLPTATPSLRDNPTLLLSIGTQKGPLSWRMRNDRAESGRCAGQSRPKPRGGTIAWSSVRSRSQIACNASAVALSCRFSGRALAGFVGIRTPALRSRPRRPLSPRPPVRPAPPGSSRRASSCPQPSPAAHRRSCRDRTPRLLGRPKLRRRSSSRRPRPPAPPPAWRCAHSSSPCAWRRSP